MTSRLVCVRCGTATSLGPAFEAMRRLAGQGIAAEPSSAAAVAAALALAARGDLSADEDVVCVLTGAGAKWPDALVDALTPRELVDASPAAVRAWIDASAGRSSGSASTRP